MSAPRSVGSVSVSVVPDAEGFVDRLRAKILPGADTTGAELGRAIGSAMADAMSVYIDEIKAKLDELGSRDVTIRARVEDDGSIAETKAKTDALNSSSSNAGSGFGALGLRIAGIGLAAVAAADIAIPAILSIGAAAAGAFAFLGVGLLGLSGITGALQAHGQPSPGGGTGVANAALGQQSAQISAQQATQSAQDQLTQAIQNQAKAEKTLHDARVQALQDLQDLDNKLKDNEISQDQAAIALNQARKTLAVTLAAPGAGLAQYADQVATARINVEAAQQKVNELALAGTRLTGQDATAHKQGVAGNPNVTAAQQGLTDANKKLSEAQANIGITAQKNAIALQQAANSMVSAAAGANQFGLAMSKLVPLQQQFVNFLLSMKPLLDAFKTAASQFLPGLEQIISKVGPLLLPIVSNVAAAMGTVFNNIATALSTGQGKQFLNFLSVELPKIVLNLGASFITFGKLIATIFEAAAPLISAFTSALSTAFSGIASGGNSAALTQFFDSLIPLIKPLLDLLSSLGTLIASILVNTAPLIGPLAKLLDGLVVILAKTLLPVIKPLIAAFGNVLTAVEPLIPLFGTMVQAVLPALVGLITQLVNQGVVPLITALIKTLVPAMPGLIKNFLDLVAAVGPLIPPITQLLLTLVPLLPLFISLTAGPLTAITPLLKTVTPLVADLARMLNDVLGPAVKFITTLFSDQNKIIHTVFDNIGGFVSGALNAVVKVFNTVAGPLKAAFSAVWDGVKAVFGDVTTFFGGIANGIISVLNELIHLIDAVHIKVPKFHIPGTSVDLGGQDLGFNIPDIPHLASGGIIPATDGGMLARVAEAGVSELVMPLDNAHLSKLGAMIARAGGSGRPVNQYISTADPRAAANAAVLLIAARAV